MQKISRMLLIITFILFAAVIVTASEEKKGEPVITVDGGSKGEVSFPHKEHQEELKECNLCHDTFPQEMGVIKKMKDNKELKKKQVMNEVCLKCHKDYKKEGKKYGPISCSGCHAK
ncbi:Cytochrome c, class III family protein [Desulfamplus magnetovallimortis]|uniref:Cytochrome c, class III family protein n=1 Tax=Desulfamplus magnetovallimortis TaxID=1246637 RepID=A0A1W1H837_9BACT|nr:cytochrome c3 family protein [Desulfamplus magnetovallimortis]SLM28613.1 Cytochrome c, class III family protein [Desulfamplus magnetovallimortis]